MLADVDDVSQRLSNRTGGELVQRGLHGRDQVVHAKDGANVIF